MALAIGLIPAHAGKTNPSRHDASTKRAHPRSRGENLHDARNNGCERGSSPLTRGKPEGRDIPGFKVGLIPAHAGKTPHRPWGRPRGPAHPRSRGENAGRNHFRPFRWGSSPLTRGKHEHSGKLITYERLIPAHAGKT